MGPAIGLTNAKHCGLVLALGWSIAPILEFELVAKEDFVLLGFVSAWINALAFTVRTKKTVQFSGMEHWNLHLMVPSRACFIIGFPLAAYGKCRGIVFTADGGIKFLNSVIDAVSLVEIETSGSARFPLWCNHRFLAMVKNDETNTGQSSLMIMEFIIPCMIIIGTNLSPCPFLIASNVIFRVNDSQGELRKGRVVEIHVASIFDHR